jgi:predicted GTPase
MIAEQDAHLKILRTIPKARVLVYGRAGMGKSSLVNRLVCKDMREITHGNPCHERASWVTISGIPLSFWDGEGLEVEDFEKRLKDLKEVIFSENQSVDESKHIATALIAIGSSAK